MVRKVKLGIREFDFPSKDVQQLEDCNHLLNNAEALRKEMDDKGFLFIRQLHDREEVLSARLAVLGHIKSTGENKLDTNHPWQSGVLDARCGRGCIPFMEGKNEVTECEAIKNVFQGERPFTFFRKYFDASDVLTFDYKWLRAVHTGGFTGAHVDNVYMGRGTGNLLTMWTPVGDTTVEMGTLAVCERSHKLDSFGHFQKTYGETDLEKENIQGSGWFTLDPAEITTRFGGQWKTSDFSAGDVIIFGMRTVHMSTVNVTNLARVSCDTRWQPAHEAVDPRYMGEFKPPEPTYGIHGAAVTPETSAEPANTIDTLKARWGFT